MLVSSRTYSSLPDNRAHTHTQFLFINATFQPSPDEVIADLFKCFQSDGKLVVNYATTAAWG